MMRGWLDTVVQAWSRRWTARRRARRLRQGARPSSAPRALALAWTGAHWIGAAGIVGAVAGALLIAAHARHLAASSEPGAAVLQGAGLPVSLDALQPAAPGAQFKVPPTSGIGVTVHGDATVLVASSLRSAPPVRIDLCTQMLDSGSPRLLPLRIGYRFADVARWVARNEASASPVALRNIALAGPDVAGIPQVQLSGVALPDFAEARGSALRLDWAGADAGAHWLGESGGSARGAQGSVELHREGWLVWKDAALRFQRRASNRCPQAGELLVQLFRANAATPAAKALVVAFPAHGAALSAWLAPGSYQVPVLPRASLEDQALFQALQQHGLVRLGAGGLAELAPRDLAAWQASGDAARAAQLAGWPGARLDAESLKLLKRLYRMADGNYVREQVQVFNSERRLLAWRLKPQQGGEWQASVATAPASTTAAMPPAAARLFADVPQGWAPWSRVKAWPDAAAGAPASLTLALPRAAQAGQTIELMLVGRLLSLDGAQLRGRPRDACSGRDCPSPASVQSLLLDPQPGARSVTLTAAPLRMAGLAGDQQYRHLRLAGGQLAWQPLAANSATARAAPLAGVTLADRHGTVVWSGGEPTRAAVDAGLAPLLGIRAGHANSVAGMLARVPAPDGVAHSARLTLDLALQTASQQALDCIGMRRGHWNGATCSGAQAVVPGRQAGLVILDTGSGDVLAAAGAGGGAVTPANWSEVRDFDRANPARSPLRLPAFQHDGGAHRSPGSTFKVISALGLELAAKRDPQLEALLAGLPLPAINRMAQSKGFAFQTNAASYPLDTRLAHITNYKDQHLDRRAQDGRLGLSQALTYSLNTWFAWSGELSDRSLFGRADGGAPDLQALDGGALDSVRPIVAMAHRLGFEQAARLDGGLLPPDFPWSAWDALQASAAHIDPIHTRHELRQMAIGLRMQVTPLQMALVAGAVGEGRVIAPRLLLSLDGHDALAGERAALGVRLDRVRAGMKGVVDSGTAAAAFRGAGLDAARRGLSGKTGTSPSVADGRDLATVWFTGWLEPGSLPGQTRRLAVAAFVSHSDATGGEHAAPIVAAVLAAMAGQNPEQKGK
ncbi:penicillin-binding transpeptidase domain-containing protein [Massilia antarctica]|uniref:penicillin-binding transpeptidase domain-containing protein n=1 Tax=Massilia antarctica TaxID=2765360 RepID=UPI0027D9B480|nr:penicillin-binding transpeptidase domain-containing protein [Massilia antarctica]